MNIFISANDNYIYAARVMLTSLFLNNPQPHNIYFMYSMVSQENLRVLEQLVQNYGGTFIPTRIDNSRFQDFIATDRFPAEVYYRLLIPSLAPESATRALWLDVDLVVNRPLDEFYGQDLEDYVFSACRDIGDYETHLRSLSCPPGTIYINSGVILFNLEQMRTYQLQDYHNFYLSHKESIIWPDQDILNGMFCGQIKIWDCDLYNVQVSNWRFHGQYDLDNAHIVHYIGNSKPWFPTYTNSAARIWDHYHRIAFGKGSAYLVSRQCHRALEKFFHSPFRSFRGKLYRQHPRIRRLLNKLKQ